MTQVPGERSEPLSREVVRELYSSRARELWAIFYSYCNDRCVAEDVVSESFARLMEQCGKPMRNPRAWLVRVGKNLIIDHRRRRRRTHSSATNQVLVDGEPLPEHGLMNCELRDVVRDSLRDLRVDYRLVLVLRYGLGYSVARISAVTSCSKQAVYMQLSRARSCLADGLIARGVDQPDHWILKSDTCALPVRRRV